MSKVPATHMDHPCPASRCVVLNQGALSITAPCHCKCVLMAMTHDTKQKGTHWSVTQFGIAEGEEQMASAHQRGWTVQGQKEKCPTTDRFHWQLYVHTPHTRMSQVIKHFRGGHVEPARNASALQTYVVKEETRAGALPDLSKYPTLNDWWTLTYGLVTDVNSMTQQEYDVISRNADIYDCLKRDPVKVRGWLVEACEEESDPDRPESDRYHRAPPIWTVARILVRRGYHVEMMVSNPQLKEAYKNSFWSCMLRTHDAIEARRQTPDTDTAVLPTVEDTNHADRPPPPCPAVPSEATDARPPIPDA